jgi:hypothetical protein
MKSHVLNPIWKLVFLFSFLCTACVSSLEPWAPEQAMRLDTQLQGCWLDGEDVWLFLLEDDQQLLLLTEKGETALFEINCFALDSSTEGPWRYLNLKPVKHPDVEGNSLEATHTLPTNGLLRYQTVGEKLILSTLDVEPFKRRLALADAPRYLDRDDRTLMTDSSEALWHFLQAVSKEDSLFTSPDTLLQILTAMSLSD